MSNHIGIDGPELRTPVPSWRRGTARPLLWLVVVVAATANVASGFGGLPLVVNLVTGLTLLGAVAGLIALRNRDSAA